MADEKSFDPSKTILSSPVRKSIDNNSHLVKLKILSIHLRIFTTTVKAVYIEWADAFSNYLPNRIHSKGNKGIYITDYVLAIRAEGDLSIQSAVK
jgi:hypothetical protein